MSFPARSTERGGGEKRRGKGGNDHQVLTVPVCPRERRGGGGKRFHAGIILEENRTATRLAAAARKGKKKRERSLTKTKTVTFKVGKKGKRIRPARDAALAQSAALEKKKKKGEEIARATLTIPWP